VLVKSPGVPREAPLVRAAERRRVPVWSEVELGYRLLEPSVVAVTGTNGKTTTTELLAAILRAPAAGNVGRALSDLDGEVEPGDTVVCEVSSFQLEDVDEFRPHVALLLNLEPDHLDRHGTFEAYRDAKLRVFENQTPEDVAVVPRRFGEIPGRGQRVEFDAQDELPAEPLLRGEHNRENAAAATAAARALGVDDETIAEALRTFAGVAHRLEPVGERRGVRYVNDSKATNVAAARRALAAYRDERVHLILGGSRKGESFDVLASDIGANVVSVLLVGESADDIARALDEAGVAYEHAGDVATAVRRAAERARAGDVVLLSPACASFDQFANFEERGDAFRTLVRALPR
jgi:UDP-N-acetylmuramoylalanine--D-glutamate ligase